MGLQKGKKIHLLEIAQAILFQMYVSKSCWVEAILTIDYLINRVLSRVLDNVSPLQFMISHFPPISTM